MRFASDWSKIMHRITAKIFKVAQNLSRIAYARFQTNAFYSLSYWLVLEALFSRAIQ